MLVGMTHSESAPSECPGLVLVLEVFLGLVRPARRPREVLAVLELRQALLFFVRVGVDMREAFAWPLTIRTPW